MGENKFKSIFLLLFSTIISSCAGSGVKCEKGTLPVINFDEAIENIGEINLSNYAADIEYIPLETASDALLGDKIRFAVDEHYMYIVNSRGQKTVHLFDLNGKFIKNVGSKGRAKGEFMGVRSIIPMDNGEFMVLGGNSGVVYSSKTGKFIKDINFDELTGEKEMQRENFRRVIDMQHTRGDIFYIIEDIAPKDQNIVRLDISDSSVVRKALDQRYESTRDVMMYRDGKQGMETIKDIAACDQIRSFNGKAYICSTPVDTLYEVDDNMTRIPKYAIEYGSFNRDLSEKWNPEFPHIYGSQIMESNKMLILWIAFHKSLCVYPNGERNTYLLYDKKSGRSHIVGYSEEMASAALVNDLDSGLPFWPFEIQGEKMYMLVAAERFIELSKKYDSPRVKEIASALTDESNPVLVAVTLK